MEMIPDRAIREAIRDETARSVVVEASAGTGKTTLLTDRVCSIISRGTSLENLAVVTFTEAAASELRTRIREKIPPKAQEKMDQAWIHTIHGFASRLLREYYHLCDGIPEFSTEAGHFSRREIEILWDLFLVSVRREDLEASSEALRHPGSSVLLDAAWEMETHRWLMNPDVLGDTKGSEQALRNECTSRLKALENTCLDKSDKLCMSISRALEYLENEGTQGGLDLRGGTQKNWGGKDNLAEVKRELKECKEAMDIIKGYSLMIPVLPAIEKLVFPFLNRIRRIWDQDPTRLSFDDLLFLAGESVIRSSVLRKKLNDKFRYVFIDEFQDTSLVQVRLFMSILQGGELQRKLTVVGDPKQSIYGWRSADMETYKETVDTLGDKGALSETIRVNFRSTKSVIRFINSFGKALLENTSPEEEPFASGYSPIEPAPGADEGDGVFIHLLPEIKERKSAGIYSALQAKNIAELISDPGSTAVLYRTKTHMDELLKEFDRRGIPYTVEAGRDFHDRPEVRDTSSLLRYLLYPDDEVAEINTLRSMFFAVDDREITRWKQTGILSDELKRVFFLVSSLRSSARTLPAHMVIRTLFRNTCLLESIRRSGHQTGRRLANMRFIMELSEGTPDLLKLLETLEGKAPISADEPSSPPEGTGGAVTVSTIHGAKGLAWEHVIIADPGTSFNENRKTVLSDQRTGCLGLKLGHAISGDYPALKEREKHRARAEYRRLLYVAVTRPRRRLDFFLEPLNSPDSPCGIVHSALADSEHFSLVEIENMEIISDGTAFPEIPRESSGDPFESLIKTVLPHGETERDKAMRLGTEVHGVMEVINMTHPEEWLKTNRMDLERILEFPDKTVSLVKSFFESFSMSGAEVLGREYPIITGGKFYYVDLLLERGGCLEAVDYKTDTGDPEERKLIYLEHQRLYKRELEKATGRPVSVFLVFLHHKMVYEIK